MDTSTENGELVKAIESESIPQWQGRKLEALLEGMTIHYPVLWKEIVDE